MTVLILTGRDDVTTDLVVRRLAEKHRTVHRLTFDDDVILSGTPGQITIKDAHRVTTNPRSVYWRSPGPVQSERAKALVGLLRTLPDLVWVNHPDNNERARHKPGQLTVAEECGFLVPDTLISNDPDEIRVFHRNHPDHIAKPLHQGEVFIPLGNGMVHQRRIFKRYDIRVTVVGGRLFPCRIRSGLLDWREDPEAVYEPAAAPREIVKAIYRFMEWYGLYYAAFDFAVSAAGPWYFLECNPDGQFGWLERRTGLSISSALATLLAEEPDIQSDLNSRVGEHRRSSGQG
ncbi:hypothetical protein [Streptomyces yaizuensis]|uniref:ATP-grasp ribosomal peptide maturase n=1 Tax=Streptomyces yaizuensis TaxID=2989713 RepID=A0ABQ5P3N6_9ACTN|nr:hypothetical protein [Streptomyces sp. YSPA8]GLF97213.1 ATP-grasp ribosomal peptide maturase [Streptomyces sp. YSPA8]